MENLILRAVRGLNLDICVRHDSFGAQVVNVSPGMLPWRSCGVAV